LQHLGLNLPKEILALTLVGDEWDCRRGLAVLGQ